MIMLTINKMHANIGDVIVEKLEQTHIYFKILVYANVCI